MKNDRYQDYVETTNLPLKNILASGGQIYQEFLQGEDGSKRGLDNWVDAYDKEAAEAVKKNPDLMDPEDMNPLVAPMIASVARALSGNPQASEGLETAQAIIRETVFYAPDRMRMWAQANMNSADQQKQSAAIMISLSETFGTSGRALFDAQFFTEDFQKINKGADKESTSQQELLYNDVMSEFLTKDSDFEESLPNANRVIQYFARVNGEAGITEALGSYVKKAILTGDSLDKEDLLKDVENLASGFGRYAEVGGQGFFIPTDKDTPQVGSWWQALRPEVVKQSTLDSRAEAATSWLLNSGKNENTLNFYEFSETDARNSDTDGDIRTAKNLNENFRRGLTQEEVTKRMIEDGSLVPLFLRDKTGRDYVVFKYRENRKLNTWKFVRPANGGPPIRASAAAFYGMLHVPRINSTFESLYEASPNRMLRF